jgi:hypothetical protein
MLVVGALTQWNAENNFTSWDPPQNRISRMFAAGQAGGTVNAIAFPAGVTTISGIQDYMNTLFTNFTCSSDNLFSCWSALQGGYLGFSPMEAAYSASVYEVQLATGPDQAPYCVAPGGVSVARNTTASTDIITPVGKWCEAMKYFQVFDESADPFTWDTEQDGPFPGPYPSAFAGAPAGYNFHPRTFTLQFTTTAISGEALGADTIANCTAFQLVVGGPTAQTITFTNTGPFAVEQLVVINANGTYCDDSRIISVPRFGTYNMELPTGCADMNITISRHAPNGTDSWVPCGSMTAADINERTISTPTIPADISVYIENVRDVDYAAMGNAMQLMMQAIIQSQIQQAITMNLGDNITDNLVILSQQIASIDPGQFVFQFNWTDINNNINGVGAQIINTANLITNESASVQDQLNQAQAAVDAANAQLNVTRSLVAQFNADVAAFQNLIDHPPGAEGNPTDTDKVQNLWMIILTIVVAVQFVIMICMCTRMGHNSGGPYYGGGGGGGAPVIINTMPAPAAPSAARSSEMQPLAPSRGRSPGRKAYFGY